MERTEFFRLQEENRRLREMVDKDRMTGLYDATAFAERADARLKQTRRGVLLLLDVDNLKSINDRYGHLIGDGILIKIAEKLAEMFLKNDLTGRVGGDEFAVFLSIPQNEDFARTRAGQIKDRLKEMEVEGIKMKVSTTIGYSVFREGEDYRSLYERAEHKLLEEKKRKKSKSKGAEHMERSVEMDILRIQADLIEREEPHGAYYQDYEVFRDIYRFVERRLLRLNASAYIVLMTLADGEKHFLPLEENVQWMDVLGDVIGNSLRAGDIFTTYSSCQYLIMLADVNGEEAEAVATRIKEHFFESTKHQDFLLHYCYPLRSKSGDNI